MAKGRRAQVVDTNVAITANRRDGGSYGCASTCAEALLAIRSSGQIVLDDQGAILAEYKSYLHHSGRPGVGDAFFRWFFNNRGRADLCCEVAITPIIHPWRRYEEFPDDQSLSDFDSSDQKFIAVSRSDPRRPPILEASDHKWLDWATFLRENGILVEFLCEEELRVVAAQKKRTRRR
jgi:hypothetical protein